MPLLYVRQGSVEIVSRETIGGFRQWRAPPGRNTSATGAAKNVSRETIWRRFTGGRARPRAFQDPFCAPPRQGSVEIVSRETIGAARSVSGDIRRGCGQGMFHVKQFEGFPPGAGLEPEHPWRGRGH